MRSRLQAGVARADITPPVGIAHANWGAQAHERAQGVDLPLWATALALNSGDESGGETAIIVDFDLIGLRADDATHIRQAVADRTGLPAGHIRLAYTHTHSGPSTNTSGGWVSGGADLVPGYVESLAAKAAGAAWEACNRMQPARIAAGAGLSTIAVNRRFVTPEDTVVVGHNWEGPVDHEVKIVRIDDLDEQPLAILVNYACHPIIVGPYNDLITPDYPGVVKRVVEAATGAKCLFLQGATGDIGPIEGCTSTEPRPIYRRLGTRLGYEAVSVALGLQTNPKQEHYVRTLESGAPLGVYAYEPILDGELTFRVASRTANLPLKTFPPVEVAEAEAQRYAGDLLKLRESGSEAEIRWAGMLAKRSRMRAERSRAYAGKQHAPLEIHAIRINDIAIVGVPGEPFVEIGLAIKAHSPFKHTLFSGYSNAGGSYVPMAHAYPVGGYEVDVTPFTPAAAEVMIQESLALLHELAQ